MYSFVLTKNLHLIISWRLRLVYYCLTGVVYWNHTEDKFKQFTGVFIANWRFLFNFGYPFVVAAHTYHNIFFKDIPDTVNHPNNNDRKLLLIVFAVLFTNLMFLIIMLNNALMEHLDEVVDSFNLAFSLDKTLKNKFKPKLTPLDGKVVEVLILFVLVVAFFAPIFISISFFHPYDPIHNLFEDVFEIHIATYLLLLCQYLNSFVSLA